MLHWSEGTSPLRMGESVMPELISSPPFLIAVAILAILLVMAIMRHAVRFLILIIVIVVILICFGIASQSDLPSWLEN